MIERKRKKKTGTAERYNIERIKDLSNGSSGSHSSTHPMVLTLCRHHPPFPPQTPTFTYSPPFIPSSTFKTLNPKPCKFIIRASNPDAQTLPKTAIQRIAEKLRSLGYVGDDESRQVVSSGKPAHGSPGEIFVPLPNQLPKQKVGYTIDESWSLPENPVPEPGTGGVITRFFELKQEVKREKKLARKEEEERAPTLAELTLPEEEVRRLKTIGIQIRKKLKVGKAGITEGIVNGIHERWRRAEVVKIRCEDICKLNMKRTHDILEV